MLVVSIPIHDHAGECRINGRPCRFLVHKKEFWFQYQADDGSWDKRQILLQTRGEGLTTYYCSAAAEAG